MKYVFLFVIRKFKKLFEVKKYRVIYCDGYYSVEGEKFGWWWDCMIHYERGNTNYMRWVDHGDGKGRKKAIKYAEMMDKQKLGLHYFTDEYKNYFRKEVSTI